MRCMLIESGAGKPFWQYAILVASYVRNRCYNRRLVLTPFEVFTGKNLDMSRVHVLGSVCFAYVEEKSKLDARSEKGIFMGNYKDSPTYLEFFPDEDFVTRSRV